MDARWKVHVHVRVPGVGRGRENFPEWKSISGTGAVVPWWTTIGLHASDGNELISSDVDDDLTGASLSSKIDPELASGNLKSNSRPGAIEFR